MPAITSSRPQKRSSSNTNAKKLEARRRLGVFYTPPELSGIVSAWAVRSSSDRILEPSFGGCVFLRSIADCLKARGSRKIPSHLYGCDVDLLAFSHLRTTFPNGVPVRNFPKKSFLKLRFTDFGSKKFDAVVGNPPYVSYHNMSIQQRNAARSVVSEEFDINSKASLWAYFVIHALSFLKRGGRMGWILPGSVSFTNYGRDLLEQLAFHFGEVTAIKLQQRCFGHVGTDESSVVLLCDRFRGNVPAMVPRTIHALDLGECSKIATEMLKPSVKPAANLQRESSLDADLAKVVGDLQAITGLRRLGEIADIKIGVVTGANRFFLLSEERAAHFSIPEDARLPFFTRFYQAPGLFLETSDVQTAQASGEDCILLDTRRAWGSRSVQAYLESFDATLRANNETFKKGAEWHQPQLGQISHGFLSYMHDSGPRLVLNPAGVYSTNSIHRVFFKPNITEAQKLLAAIGVISTLGQFIAEMEGRSYGSGVLKIEPSEARRLFVPLGKGVPFSDVKKLSLTVDKLLRNNREGEARAHADDFIFHLLPSLGRHITQERLRELLDVLRIRRSPNLKLSSRKPVDVANISS